MVAQAPPRPDVPCPAFALVTITPSNHAPRPFRSRATLVGGEKFQMNGDLTEDEALFVGHAGRVRFRARGFWVQSGVVYEG